MYEQVRGWSEIFDFRLSFFFARSTFFNKKSSGRSRSTRADPNAPRGSRSAQIMFSGRSPVEFEVAFVEPLEALANVAAPIQGTKSGFSEEIPKHQLGAGSRERERDGERDQGERNRETRRENERERSVK